MARKKRNNFALGVTVIIMFAALVGVLLFIGGGMFSSGDLRTITIRFEPGGVMPEISDGSLVMALGQKVGKVTDARIVEGEETHQGAKVKRQYLDVVAKVWARLDLRTDCQIIASGPPLGGAGILEIIHRGSSRDRLTSDQFVVGKVSGFQTALELITQELDTQNRDGLVSLVKMQLDARQRDSLIAKIHESLADINVMTARLATETDGQSDGHLLYKIHESVDRVNRALASIESLVADNRTKIDNTLSSVEHAMGVADAEILQSIAKQLDEDSPTSLIARAQGAMERLNRSLDDLNVITKEGERIVVLNSDRISELIENVSTASMSLKFGIRDLTLHPYKFFQKPSPSEAKKLSIHSAAREFAEAAAHLDDATSRLKALVDVNGGGVASNDPELTQIRSDLSAAIDRFGQVEDALWSALNK